MAGIVFQCSACSHSISSDDSLCGEITSCSECGADVLVPIPGLESGATCGDFKLLERLGAGAMGEVWLAEQTSMERRVALKVLFPQLASDKRFVERFLKEAKNSAKLSHPNIVTAFHAGVDRGIYYLAISFVSGDTIESALEKAHVYEEKEALRITRDIAAALEYAWDEYKILHRDIKPANIIIDKKGVPMLLDMGISKSLDEDSALTMTGTVVGTPYYMSPEQAIASEDVDFRSDIYSLGTTLYHMLTGSVPFQAGTAMAIIMRHLHDELPPPRERNSEISENCEILLRVMMAKKREQRPQSWSALVKDITEVLEGRPPLTQILETPSTGENVATNVSAKKGGIARKSEKKKEVAPSKGKGRIIAAVMVAAIVGAAGIGFLAFNYLNSAVGESADSSNNQSASQDSADYVAATSETPRPGKKATDDVTATEQDVYGPPMPKVEDSSSSNTSENAGDQENAVEEKNSDSASTANTSDAESAKIAEKKPETRTSQETKVDKTPAPKHVKTTSTPDQSVEKTKEVATKPAEDENPEKAGSGDNSTEKTATTKNTTAPVAQNKKVDKVEKVEKPAEVAKPAVKTPTPVKQTEVATSPDNKKDTTTLPRDTTVPTGPNESADDSATKSTTSDATDGGTAGNGIQKVPSSLDPNEIIEKNKTFEDDFIKFYANLDLTKNTKLYTGEFWRKAVGKEHTWRGKVTYVKGGWWKAEIRLACPNRMLYRGYNAILVTPEKAAAAKLKIGQMITFKGNVYSYKHKWNGLVIIYVKNVKILDGVKTEKP